MKLIDLLVQELPNRGGWPEGVVKIHQDYDGETWGWLVHDDAELLFTLDQVVTNARKCGKKEKCENMVTREQYESALAASQKPALNGGGLPPVGCECEYISNGTSWGKVKVIGLDGEKIVIRPSGEIYYAITPSNKDVFIPFRTEAERKHEAVLESICAVLEMVAQDYKREDEAKLIYEAIAAGKIPGVKLDD